MHGLNHIFSIILQPLKAMGRALSDPDSLQVQKQLPTLLASGKATRQTPHSPKVPESLQANTAKSSKATKCSRSNPRRTGSPNYSFDKRVSFVYRFAAPWYHISNCIRASMPNCRGPIRFLASPLDFGAPIPFTVDKSETYHFTTLYGR